MVTGAYAIAVTYAQSFCRRSTAATTPGATR